MSTYRQRKQQIESLKQAFWFSLTVLLGGGLLGVILFDTLRNFA
jgi:hypothetical protein